MADGKWVMTEADSKRVDLTFSGSGRPDMSSTGRSMIEMERLKQSALSAALMICSLASVDAERGSDIAHSSADHAAARQTLCIRIT